MSMRLPCSLTTGEGSHCEEVVGADSILHSDSQLLLTNEAVQNLVTQNLRSSQNAEKAESFSWH